MNTNVDLVKGFIYICMYTPSYEHSVYNTEGHLSEVVNTNCRTVNT